MTLSSGGCRRGRRRAGARAQRRWVRLPVLGFLVVVLATIWSALRPGRERWSAGILACAALLAATAAATILAGGQVLDAALDAAALTNTV